MSTTAANCTSVLKDERTKEDRTCGRQLVLRHFDNKDSRMDAAPICSYCDSLRIWDSYTPPKLQTQTGWATWNRELERRLPPKKP